MTKGFRYWFRCITVATLTALITFNPVWAGRGIRALFSKRAAPCCETPCVSVPTCCPPAAADCCADPCELAPVAISSECCATEVAVAPAVECCDAAPAIEHAPMHLAPMEMAAPQITPAPADMSVPKDLGTPLPQSEGAHDVAPLQQSPASPSVLDETEPSPSDSSEKTETTPAESTPAAPADPFGAATEPAPATPPADSPFGNAADPAPLEPAPLEPAPLEPAPLEPAPLEPAPVNDLFNEPQMKPADPAPAAADPFGAPADPAPTAPATDGLFAPPADAPAAPGGDLFAPPDAAAAPAPAGNDPFAAPALPSSDNLFDTPAADPAPAAVPAPAAGGDLFEEPEPAAPAPPTNVDDLFSDLSAGNGTTGAAETPTSESSEPAADIFGQPTSTSEGSNFDDLFGTPTTSNKVQTPVADPAVVQPVSAPAARDIFKSTRTWHDNTGLFQVDAKLIVIFADSVRLLKDNGKYCTLPLRRLSEEDRLFVEHVAQLTPGSDTKYVSAPN